MISAMPGNWRSATARVASGTISRPLGPGAGVVADGNDQVQLFLVAPAPQHIFHDIALHRCMMISQQGDLCAALGKHTAHSSDSRLVIGRNAENASFDHEVQDYKTTNRRYTSIDPIGVHCGYLSSPVNPLMGFSASCTEEPCRHA